MNACQDCTYFTSDPYNVDSCLLSGEPTFPGNFICGEFGERWYEIAKVNGKEADPVRVDLGKAIKPDTVAQALKTVQEGMKSMQSLQRQTAETHQRFLENQTQASLTVGTRPDDVATAKYKHEMQVEQLSQGRVLRRGGCLEKDDQGKWTFKSFDSKDLPDVFGFFPDTEDLTFKFDLDLSDAFPH